MENSLQHIKLSNYYLTSGSNLDVNLSYQIFGQPLHSAPVVLINHALTGNSNVTGINGWWNQIVGQNKVIDLNQYTVLCFNIPGNGFDGIFKEEQKYFKTKDIASIFLKGLELLNITQLHILIGGSIGGAIGWEMLAINPTLTQNFIPIATDYKMSDWLHSQCLVQQFLLSHPVEPLEKARLHAMLCYRTPASINQRFQNEFDTEKEILKSHDWLNYHGKSLTERFSLSSYQLVNNLLMSINADEEELQKISARIHLIAVDTDLFFPALDIKNAYNLLKDKTNIFYHEINSIHGHDAFLMEYEQLNQILNTINNEK